MKKVLIGTVTLEKDCPMVNGQFSYAADYERIAVTKGEHPIYAYADDLEKTADGKTRLGWRNYIGYDGTVIDGNVGGKPGDKTSYHKMAYDHTLAQLFFEGHEYIQNVRMNYELRPEWGIELRDFVYDNKRHFTMHIVLKDGAALTYIE